MTQEELTELNNAATDMKEHGYSEEHKRRSVIEASVNGNQNIWLTFNGRLAKRYHKKRVYDAMNNQYHEMGLTSVVFVCYKDPDGKPVVDW